MIVELDRADVASLLEGLRLLRSYYVDAGESVGEDWTTEIRDVDDLARRLEQAAA